MRLATWWRSRPAADNIMLLLIGASLVVAALRLLLVFATVPYAAYIGSKRASTNTPLLERIADSGPVTSWWGGRKLPFRAGTYLAVLGHSEPRRIVGAAIGDVIARDMLGAKVTRVIVPKDEEALYGELPGTLMVRPDGSTFLSGWAPVGRNIEFFSDVQVETADYPPFLDAAAAAKLAAATKLTERTDGFYTAEPAAGGSGTWVLLSRTGTSGSRDYLFVPVELSPAGGAR